MKTEQIRVDIGGTEYHHHHYQTELFLWNQNVRSQVFNYLFASFLFLFKRGLKFLKNQQFKNIHACFSA